MVSQEYPRSILAALFDFSFTTFASKRLIPLLYGLAVVVGAIYAAGALWVAIRDGGGVALGALIMVPLVYVIFVVYARVFLEVLVAVFRIAENTERTRV
jgi:hypothetical protein